MGQQNSHDYTSVLDPEELRDMTSIKIAPPPVLPDSPIGAHIGDLFWYSPEKCMDFINNMSVDDWLIPAQILDRIPRHFGKIDTPILLNSLQMKILCHCSGLFPDSVFIETILTRIYCLEWYTSKEDPHYLSQINILRKGLDIGLVLNCEERLIQNLIDFMIFHQEEDIILKMIRLGYPLNRPSIIDRTPLGTAIYHGYTHIMTILLKEGACPGLNHINEYIWSWKNTRLDMLPILMSYGWKWDIEDTIGLNKQYSILPIIMSNSKYWDCIPSHISNLKELDEWLIQDDGMGILLSMGLSFDREYRGVIKSQSDRPKVHREKQII